uniref:Tudor domain containing 1 n=1 Tax=Mola mola TaxID=94237 RepID=A0A3Q3X8T6_MOLML
MDSTFFPSLVRPNLPLRKPFSSPVALGAPPPPGTPTTPDGALMRPAAGTIGNGPIHLPVSKDLSVVCIFLITCVDLTGKLRCKRCKKTPYCSVVCQKEDWRAHRHICKPIDLEPVKEKPVQTTVSPVAGESTGLLGFKRVYLKDLHMPKVGKGTDIQGNVLEFYSPDRFFLLAQSSEIMEVLQTISRELQKTYSFPPAVTYIPCVGEVCAVQFSCDLDWYRGLVQTFNTDQKMANILFIDFGNEEDVPVDRIKQLASNIQPFCPCAMECSIAGVVPVAGSWSAECCISVQQLLAGKTVTVKVVETLQHGRVHSVDILLSMGKQLSTFLIEHCYAVEKKINVTPSEQDIYAIMNASLENFRRLSDGKDKNAWAQPPEPLTQAVGDSFSVVVTYLQSPTEIIVQKVENAGVIQKLQLELRKHCSQVLAPQNFRPAPGTVCCAQFSEDKLWYRAKVLAYSSKERVCVGYLDFGNSEEVDLGQLRPISSSLLALPMQAIPCGLAGVQPVGESWSKDCVLALQRRVSNRILRIEIQGEHEGKALVALIDEASDPQTNVAELLTSADFAAPAPVNTSNDQQANQKETVYPIPPPAREPLVWSCSELPCDGQTVALLASVVENPHKFYCHINNPRDHQRLIELAAELKQHCVADTSPFLPKVGEPCCAMFPDGEWYRALVNEVSEDKVFVNFMDYGFSVNLEKNHLRSITSQLLSLPFQAVRCSLAGVEPLGSEWGSEALLWFQALVDGKQFSAHAVSVSERGYDVRLESRGQDVAAALISKHLAKAPRAIPNETPSNCEEKHQEKMNETEQSQEHVQASNQAEASSKETPGEETPMLTEGQMESPTFPFDWKTVELPLNETTQPCIAAVISPSLFYLLGSQQVDKQKLQEVMMELAAYCRNHTLTSSVLRKPVPGAACCAQFSADKNWYRAVVLEVGENEMSVIYADYGNTEKVPFSSILPIPKHMLQLPFRITRCTLTGKEHFPAEWPEEVQRTFRSLLMNGVLATVQSFDGSANVLSLTLHMGSGRGHLTAMIVEALQAQAKSNSCPSTIQKVEQVDSSLSANSPAVAPDGQQPGSMPEIQRGLEDTTTTGPAPWSPQQKKSPSQNMTSGYVFLFFFFPPQIDHLEEMLQFQLSLIKQLVGEK